MAIPKSGEDLDALGVGLDRRVAVRYGLMPVSYVSGSLGAQTSIVKPRREIESTFEPGPTAAEVLRGPQAERPRSSHARAARHLSRVGALSDVERHLALPYRLRVFLSSGGRTPIL